MGIFELMKDGDYEVILGHLVVLLADGMKTTPLVAGGSDGDERCSLQPRRF